MTETVGTLLGKQPDIMKYKEAKELAFNDAQIGLEIELENFRLERIPEEERRMLDNWWHFGGDDSLRGKWGVEAKFRQPLSGQNAVDAIRELIEAAERNQITPELSPRTSVHVHLDVRDMTFEQYHNFLAVYACVEPLLFGWVKGGRDKNPYCLPLKAVLGDVHNMRKLREDGFHHILHGAFSHQKYAALNLSATCGFGSIEFRHLGGCFDYDRLITWVNIILCIKRYVVLNPNLEIDKLPHAISASGEYTFCRDIFGKLVTELTYMGFEEDVREGIRIAQLFIYKDSIEKAASWIKDELFDFETNEELVGSCPAFWKHRNHMYQRMTQKGLSAGLFTNLISGLTVKEEQICVE